MIRNVRRKGDAAFTTGDIMYWDEFGYLYFKDRIGDTYRYFSETVQVVVKCGRTSFQCMLATLFIEDAVAI